MQTVFLVSCVSLKLGTAAPARDLYQSPWFRYARAYVEQQGRAWYILSARHGLVLPTQPLAPYNLSLHELSAPARRRWAAEVAADLCACHRLPTRFVVLAGRVYRNDLEPELLRAGHICQVPLQGLGIGQQLAWLKTNIQP